MKETVIAITTKGIGQSIEMGIRLFKATELMTAIIGMFAFIAVLRLITRIKTEDQEKIINEEEEEPQQPLLEKRNKKRKKK